MELEPKLSFTKRAIRLGSRALSAAKHYIDEVQYQRRAMAGRWRYEYPEDAEVIPFKQRTDEEV